jgi:hypothetical protein
MSQAASREASVSEKVRLLVPARWHEASPVLAHLQARMVAPSLAVCKKGEARRFTLRKPEAAPKSQNINKLKTSNNKRI